MVVDEINGIMVKHMIFWSLLNDVDGGHRAKSGRWKIFFEGHLRRVVLVFVKSHLSEVTKCGDFATNLYLFSRISDSPSNKNLRYCLGSLSKSVTPIGVKFDAVQLLTAT